jgi:predicted Zn-dependent peptidase
MAPWTAHSRNGVAGALHAIEQYQLGLDHLERYPGIMEEITAEQVMDVAARRLHPDRCIVAVAGPYPLADAAAAEAGSEDPDEERQ